MKISVSEKRLNAIKKRFFLFPRTCDCCKTTIVLEKMWFVDRWHANMRVHRYHYCTKCMKTKEDVLTQIQNDECSFGIAFVDSFSDFF